jgi:antirestriction protein ArdC
LAPTSAGRERLARYANRITRHETDTDSGVEVARDIHFLKGYTVFNVEQNRAFYRPSTDSIVLPLFEAFCDPESYYATLAHETTHDADPRIMPRRIRSSLEKRSFRSGQSA